MLKTISARISEDLYQAIDARVQAGLFANRSQAVAYYVRAGLQSDLETVLRRVLREELAHVQTTAPAEQAPANPKRTRMLEKVQR